MQRTGERKMEVPPQKLGWYARCSTPLVSVKSRRSKEGVPACREGQ